MQIYVKIISTNPNPGQTSTLVTSHWHLEIVEQFPTNGTIALNPKYFRPGSPRGSRIKQSSVAIAASLLKRTRDCLAAPKGTCDEYLRDME